MAAKLKNIDSGNELTSVDLHEHLKTKSGEGNHQF